jgi:hypothetical protein
MNTIYLPYTKPINGMQLAQELNGVSISLVDNQLRFVGDIDEKTAQQALDAHIPTPPKEPTVIEKLASVGLSINDLKGALGL